MNRDDLQPGLVFRWNRDGRLGRILVADGQQVMYDAFWDHSGKWGLEDLAKVRRQRVYYYRTDPEVLFRAAEVVSTNPMGEVEATLHRPDLPTVPLLLPASDWPSAPWSRREAADVLAASQHADMSLTAARLALIPSGPRGGDRPSQVVEADVPDGFAFAELLSAASTAQAPYPQPPGSGIAIRRAGLLRGAPAFFIGPAAEVD
jgi:hypothetical protein